MGRTRGTGKADPARVERFLELLDLLGERVAAAERAPADFGTGVTLHRAETHAIRVLGGKPGCNLTGLAQALGVTKGAASQLVSRLVRKGLVRKSPSPESGREVLLQLTDRGWIGFQGHEHFHQRVQRFVERHWPAGADDRLDALNTALREIVDLVSNFAQRQA